MPRFVIFDIDGTLVDSIDLHAHSWQETFRFFGKEIPFEHVRRQIGKGGRLAPTGFLDQRAFAERMQACSDSANVIGRRREHAYAYRYASAPYLH